MKPIVATTKKNLQETKKQLFFQTATLINSAFALVAALAWNEAIKEIIVTYIPAGSSLYSKLIYAFLVTLIVVLVSMRLTKVINELKPDDEDDKN